MKPRRTTITDDLFLAAAADTVAAAISDLDSSCLGRSPEILWQDAMTTVQTMLMPYTRLIRGGWKPRALLISSLVCAAAISGCNSGSGQAELVPPELLVAPYDTSRGEVLWAVAPLGNESGVSTVDTDMVADALASKIDEARGIACLPLNRTIAAMRSRGMRSVRTPGDARTLATALGVDAVLVGNITAYDPYDPPKLGLSLALYSRQRQGSDEFDPVKLKTSFSDYGQVTRSQFADRPAAVVTEHLDGANHEVQMELRRYASGRHDHGSALGWRSSLASMDLYTEFAAHFAVSRLLEQERLRLGQPSGTVSEAQAPTSQQP